jgi:RNA polymerase sigma-70 factor (family 1)
MVNYSEHSDRDLLLLLKQDNEAAFAEIYQRYKWVLYLHAAKRVNDREEAKDIVQELFTTLWDRRQVFDLQTHLSGYLYTAVRNRVISRLSHEKVVDTYMDAIRESASQGNCITDHKARENNLAAIIEQEINELPERMREVFILSRKHHLSHKEIAGKLGIAESTVKKQVSNALATLRVKLGLFAWLFLLIRY